MREGGHRNLFLGVLLVGAAFLAYFPALTAGFVWDDDSSLTRNVLIRASDGLSRIWGTTQPTDYWPVTYSSFWIEWRLWRGQAAGYHAVNLALHLVNACLLWAILRRLRLPGPFLAALLFAVHPVNVESVAWIAERKNLMAMLFFLASIWCYLKADPTLPGPVCRASPSEGESSIASSPAKPFYWLSLLAFVLAMLSKGSVAMLPVLLLGLIAWRRRLTSRDFGHALPFFAVAAVLVAVDIWFQRQSQGVAPIRSAGFVARLLGAGTAVWFYLSKAVLPANLCFVYPQWAIKAGDLLWWLPLIGAVGLTGALWRRTRPALFAWGYFCVMLVPVMGFTDVYFMKYSLVADHYQYLAIIGPCAFAAACWARWNSADRSGAAIWAAAAVLGILVGLTWRQCRMYRDSQTLFEATIARNPDCGMAHTNLGMVLLQSGDATGAVRNFGAALRLDPGNAEAHGNLGIALSRTGDGPGAEAQFAEALRLQPNYAEARSSWGSLLLHQGRADEAVAQFLAALRLKPDYAGARSNLGIALAVLGRTEEARRELARASQLAPDDPEVHANFARVLGLLGRWPEALAQDEEAVRLEPDQAEYHFNLGTALFRIGKVEAAIGEYALALRVRPNDAQTHNNLGNAFVRLGRLPEAIAHFQDAVRLDPAVAEFHFNLASALAQSGRAPAAIVQYEEGLRLKPDNMWARQILLQLQTTPPRPP